MERNKLQNNSRKKIKIKNNETKIFNVLIYLNLHIYKLVRNLIK